MRGKAAAIAGLALALAAAWASPRDSGATTFAPFFGPGDFYTLSPTTLGAFSDVRAQFNIFAPSSNTSQPFTSINFADGNLSIADSASIPGIGAYIGTLSMIQIMGIANGGCGSVVPVSFNLVEAATDTTARSITNNGPMTLATGILAGDSTLSYNHPFDPMGVRSDGMPLNEIQIDSEQMLITAVSTPTNSYTVVRGWSGTMPAPHAAGAEIKRVNVLYPAGPYWNLYENFVQDDGDFDNNGVAEFAAGSGSPNANMIADGADGLPYFVRDSLDPNRNAADGGAQQARARYAGVARNAAHVLQMFQILVLEPGTLANLPNLDWATPAWGYPVVTMYQDPVGPPSNDYGGSDLCNFSSHTTLFGVPHDNACTGNVSPPVACTGQDGNLTYRLAVDGGCPATSPTNPNECGLAGQVNGICPATTCPRHTNPGTAQTTRFYQYTISQRDYDNDGHENKLDVCHSDPNPNWNPRVEGNFVSGQDADGDGLPTPCDPNDAQFIEDHDGDGWVNRLEACPTVADAAPGGGSGTTPNTLQWDQDVPAGQPVPDGGPPADDIAPACDIAAESCLGCPQLTATGANGHYHATAAAQTICIGAGTSDCDSITDVDGDGVVSARDTCISGANPPLTFPDAPPLGGAEPGSAILTANANAGATSITVDSITGFTQGSPIVITDPLETVRYLTSQPFGSTIQFTPALTNAHQIGDPVAQISFAQSMRDLNNDGFSDIADISLVSGVFGSEGGNPHNDGLGDSGVPGYQGRYDLNYDSFVDISDISALTGVFGAACGPPP